MKRQPRKTGKSGWIAFVALVITMAVVTSGCRMADPVYDYCSPVFSGRGDDEPLCDPLYRAGSIYYRGGTTCGTPATGSAVQNPVSKPTPKSERIPPAASPARSDSVPTSVSPITTDLDSRLAPGPATVTQPTPLTPPNAPRFRAPATPTRSPFDALPPLPDETTPQTQKPANHGVTLESLRALDPSITDVEIVEVRE